MATKVDDANHDANHGSRWERKHIRQSAIGAFKTGVASVLCLGLGNLLGLTHSYWAAISAIVVMSSESAMSLVACRDRVIGTAIGALLGWATSHVWHGHYLVYGLGVMVCLLACSTLKFEKVGTARRRGPDDHCADQCGWRTGPRRFGKIS